MAKRISDVIPPVLREEIVEALPFEQYLALPAINSTSLKCAIKETDDGVPCISMKALKYGYEHGREDSDDMLFGRALHCLLLEPGEFEDRYTFYGGTRNRRHKAYQEFLEENPGKEVLKKSGANSWDAALQAAEWFCKDPVLDGLTESGRGEVTVLCSLFELPIQVKVRLDWVSASAKCLTDIKSARNVSPRLFGRQFCDLGYGMQLGLYQEAWRQVTGLWLPVKVLAVEKSGPWEAVVYTVPEEVLEQGRDLAKDLLTRLVECIEREEWPGISGGEELPLHVPAFAMGDGLDWGE